MKAASFSSLSRDLFKTLLFVKYSTGSDSNDDRVVSGVVVVFKDVLFNRTLLLLILLVALLNSLLLLSVLKLWLYLGLSEPSPSNDLMGSVLAPESVCGTRVDFIKDDEAGVDDREWVEGWCTNESDELDNKGYLRGKEGSHHGDGVACEPVVRRASSLCK